MSLEAWAEDVVDQRWQDVLTAIEAKHSYDLAPWQPLPGENRLAFSAFRHYVDSIDRKATATALALSVTIAEVRRWCTTFEWDRRAEMYDQWSDRQTDEARAEMLRKVSVDNARAFARLPSIIDQAQSLVQGALSAEMKRQQDALEANEDVEPLSISMAIKLSEAMRALLAETHRMMGQKVEVNVNVGGKVQHEVSAPRPTDVLAFAKGLSDANLIDASSYELGTTGE